MGFDFAAVRGAFFDSGKVASLVDRKQRAAFSKFGAFVRRRAKSSIRKRKKPSEPGSPPSSHVGTLSKLLFFSFDARTKSVVVGPVPFGRGVAPRALENGGPSNKIVRRGLRAIRIRPRPFMVPAMQAELPKFLPLLKG